MQLIAGLTAPEWISISGAAFSAIAAGAAWATVYRVERERWRSTLPSLHVEVIVDATVPEVRMTIVNLGGPAREVTVMGVLGEFGIYGHLPPSGYWQSGERRVLRISMEPKPVDEAQVAVMGRDLAKRHVIIGTIGGATYRIPLRKAKASSQLDDWKRLFPASPSPLDAKHGPMNLELLERET